MFVTKLKSPFDCVTLHTLKIQYDSYVLIGIFKNFFY